MRKTFFLMGLTAVLLTAGGAEAKVRCTNGYAPVCARGGEGVRTYDNPSCARAVRARILHAGRCRHQIEPVRPNPWGPERCTADGEHPVCAEFGPTRLTFPSVCHARTAGATVVSWGACWY